MKEHPILFSGPMVRAILTGDKTQTRRVVTVPWHKGKRCAPYEPYYDGTGGKLFFEDAAGEWHPMEERCPYGQPGDRLWVRETWKRGDESFADGIHYAADNLIRWFDGSDHEAQATAGKYPRGGKWRPSIHMPRAFSRLLLEVLSVRVERVQDISEEDALAEGSFLGRCPCLEMQAKSRNAIEAKFRQTGCYIHGTEFRELWDSINAKLGFGWDVNPLVWVVEFRRVDR